MTRLKRHLRSFFLRQESRCLLAETRGRTTIALSPSDARVYISSHSAFYPLRLRASFSRVLQRRPLALALSRRVVSLFSFHSLSHFPSSVFSFENRFLICDNARRTCHHPLPPSPAPPSRRRTRTAAIIEEYCPAWTANRTRL